MFTLTGVSTYSPFLYAAAVVHSPNLAGEATDDDLLFTVLLVVVFDVVFSKAFSIVFHVFPNSFPACCNPFSIEFQALPKEFHTDDVFVFENQ